MPNRIIPGQKFYTGGTGIEIDNDKVISLKLRDENNLIFVNENNEIYVDLQLPDEIEPTDAFPVGVTTGRVLVGDGRDKTGTIISAKTTSGDEIKVLYADEGTLRMDNGTGTFKQIYFKADVDAIAQAIWNYIYANCNTKTFYTGTYDVSLAQAVYDWISQGNYGIVYFNPVSGIKRDVIFPPTTTETGTISSWSYTDVRQATGGMFYEDLITLEFGVSDGVATTGINTHGTVVNNDGRIIIAEPVAPNPIEGTTWYDTTNNAMKVWDGTAWQLVGGTDIEYVTQAEYNALLPGALTDNKHYFIYTKSGGGWQPGANTLAYYPLTSQTTVNDMKGSGTAYNLTNSGITFGTYNGVDCANTNTAGTYLAGDLGFKLSNGSFTINMYGYKTGYYQVPYIYDFGTHNNYKAIIGQRDNSYIRFSFWYGDLDTPSAPANNTWANLCFTYDLATQTQKIYINGTFITSQSGYSTDLGSTEFKLLSSVDSQSTFYGGLSKFIIEDQVRDATMVSDYFNQTKGDYGIS